MPLQGFCRLGISGVHKCGGRVIRGCIVKILHVLLPVSVLLFVSVTMAVILLPSIQCDDNVVPEISDGESKSDGDVVALADVEEDPKEEGISNILNAIVEQMDALQAWGGGGGSLSREGGGGGGAIEPPKKGGGCLGKGLN